MKEYKFLLTDDFFSDTYYDWLGKLLHQLKGVRIKEEDNEKIIADVDEDAVEILNFMQDIDAIPSPVEVN